MRLILKVLALPVLLVTWIIYAICTMLFALSEVVLGIISFLVLIASIVLFFIAGMWSGLAFMFIAFLISPFGLPLVAAWATEKIEDFNFMLKDFITS